MTLKKSCFRILGLAAVLALTMLTTAGAAAYDCIVQCSDGTSWQGTTSTLQECCSQFNSICSSYGSATWERPGGGLRPCPSAIPPQ